MRTSGNCEINGHILRYIEMVENREIQACKEQHLLVAYIRKCFKTEPIYTDETQLKKYLNMAKYFPYVELFEWEVFVLALHCCTYRKKDRRPRWPDLFALMGRGAGKDGFIAFVDFCLASPHNGINAYNIDMVANNEKQAKAPFDDIYSVLTNPDNTEKLRKFFYWNKEVIKCRQTGAEIQFHTNNPKGKDGLRPGYIVFNEIHQYENYDNINVFTTALGKKPHPRRAYITTNGEVRDGPLDHLLERCLGILEKGDADNGMLPFICRLDEKEEVHNFNMWEKANPSLRYRPDLREEMEKEYRDWLVNPFFFTDFMKKRMNMPGGKKEEQVTSWELIKASCSPVPKERLRGRSAVAGIDYAMISDFASAGILLREGDKRYWITHSWLCEQSKDIPRLKCPYKDWARQGFLTLVSDVEIHPDYITEWIMKQALQFNITKLAMDHHRFALLAKSLAGAGYDPKGEKNLKLVRPSDIMMVAPVIDSCFNNELFAWGDNPVMRWAVNNTKKIRSGVRTGNDTGNYVYGKIEAKSRKTDPFLALVAAMTIEGEIEEEAGAFEDIPVITA